MENHNKKVLVIGVDGATFDLIEPWCRKGHLPTFNRLLSNGAHGQLESTLPPVTAPAWASMITGKNPAGHGCFDFMTRMDTENGDVGLVSSKSIRTKTLWTMLSEAGIRIGAVNVPVTYPPEKVHGFMISGMLSPNNEGVSYPEKLIGEMAAKSHPYRVDIMEKYREGNEGAFLDDVLSLEEERVRSTLWLMKNKEWDFFFVVFKAPDYGAHFFWKYMDKSHPQYMGEGNGFEDAIMRCYKTVDSGMDKLIQQAGKDIFLFLVSDHGAGPLHKMVNLNIYLRKNKFLYLKPTFKTMLKRMLFRIGLSPNQVYRTIKRLHLEKIVVSKSKRVVTRTLSTKFLSFNDVDWNMTKAYSRGYLGQIFITAKGEEYQRVREKIIDALFKMKDPSTGEKIVTKIFKKEDIYSGKFIDEAPDLVLIMKDYLYISYPLYATSPSVIVPHIEGRNGHHKQHGIFLTTGRGIKAGEELHGLKIYDVCPTILHIFGLPIPDDMDGRVIRSIFEEGSDISKREPVYEKVKGEDRLGRTIKDLKLSGRI